MVLPTNARQTGKTVRWVYVFAVVIFASIALSLLLHQKAAALLPLSNLPIVGQPLANTVNALTDRVITPTTSAVTNRMPEPIGATVQAPVTAVTRALQPIVGPTTASPPTSAVPPQTAPGVPLGQNAVAPVAPVVESPSASSATTTAARSSQSTTPRSQSTASPRPTDSPTRTIDTPIPLFGGFASLLSNTNYSLLSQDITRNFPKSDTSLSASATASAIAAIMAAVFAAFIGMIYRYNHLAATAGELALSRKDIIRSSLIVTSVLVVGSATLLAALY